MRASVEFLYWVWPAVAVIFALLGTWSLGSRAVGWLARYCREPAKHITPALDRLQRHKHATPTMGGLFVLTAWLLAVVALSSIDSPAVLLGIATCGGFAVLGVADDMTKIHVSRRGLSARTKLVWQLLLATGIVALAHWCQILPPATQRLTVAGFCIQDHLGIAYFPFAVLLLIGTSNAVNLTDGLDGLAGGCLTLAFGTYAVIALVTAGGDANTTSYMAALMSSAAAGAVAGFLKFNRRPACVFMGDTGSLALGALLAYLALLVRQELLLAVIGGVFLIEAVSVILQVTSFRYTGRRVFRCAPLHHHFQLAGWSESKTVRRFCLASAAFALAGLVVFSADRPQTNQPPKTVATQAWRAR